jgi:hypothetical protein
MAYLRDIPKPRCSHAGCTKRATFTLINRFNAPCGDYCPGHGRKACSEMERREQDNRTVGDVR